MNKHGDQGPGPDLSASAAGGGLIVLIVWTFLVAAAAIGLAAHWSPWSVGRIIGWIVFIDLSLWLGGAVLLSTVPGLLVTESDPSHDPSESTPGSLARPAFELD